MRHSSEIISIDVYGNNEEIISDFLKELKPLFKMCVTPNKSMLNGDNFLENIEDWAINEYVV